MRSRIVISLGLLATACGVAYAASVMAVRQGGTGQSSYTKGDLLVASGSTTLAKLGVGLNTQVLTADSTQTTGTKWATPSGGTATSVALTAPAELSVSGSPITTSGTLALTWANASPSTIFAGPTYGSSSGTPAFKKQSLVAPWSLATKPDTADSRDDEFENDLSAWTLGTGNVATAIDPFAAFSTSAVFRYSVNSFRPGWLMFQPDASGTYQWIIHKSVTLGTDEFVWARLSSNRNTSAPGNDYGIALYLTATSAGLPDQNNAVGLFLNEQDVNSNDIQYDCFNNGVNTGGTVSQGTGGNQIWQNQFIVAYVAIWKRTNTYHYWVGNESGSWLWITSCAYTGTGSSLPAIDRVAIKAGNASTNKPGTTVMGVDFIRLKATATLIP